MIDEPDFLMSTAKRDQYGCNKAKKENLFSLENIKKNSQIVKGDNYRFTCYFFYTIQYLFCDMRRHISTITHKYCTVLLRYQEACIFIYIRFSIWRFFLLLFHTFFFLHARIITTICSIEKCGVFGSWFILYINANNFLYIFFIFFGWHWSSLNTVQYM